MSKPELLRVGELAKAVGKTVRAIHLYEELGLVRPATRTEGGFRLYEPEAKKRIAWIIKLQAIGFKLSEIQEFVKAFEHAPSGREATTGAREVFAQKQREIREQITQLQIIENDLSEALAYLDACQECSTAYTPSECSMCDHQGHERGSAPPLFATLSRTAADDLSTTGLATTGLATGYDVPVSDLSAAKDQARDQARKSDPAVKPGDHAHHRSEAITGDQ